MKLRNLLWIIAFVPAMALAQPTQQEARRMAYAEAQRQGVDPAELEARLQSRGINTATLSMSDIPRVQPIVEEEIAKMKAEQAASASTKQAASTGSLSGTELSAKGGEQSEASIQTTTTELAAETVQISKTERREQEPRRSESQRRRCLLYGFRKAHLYQRILEFIRSKSRLHPE